MQNKKDYIDNKIKVKKLFPKILFRFCFTQRILSSWQKSAVFDDFKEILRIFVLLRMLKVYFKF